MSFCGNENKAWLLISPSTSKYQLLFCWHCSCYLYSLPRVLRRVNVPYSKIRFKPTQTDQPSIIPFIFLQENTISRSFGFCHWGRLWCTVAPPSFDALALQYSLSLIGGVLCVIVFSAYPSSCLFCRKFIHAYFDHFHFLVHTLSWFRVCSSQAILRRRSCIKRILRHCVLRPVLHRVVSLVRSCFAGKVRPLFLKDVARKPPFYARIYSTFIENSHGLMLWFGHWNAPFQWQSCDVVFMICTAVDAMLRVKVCILAKGNMRY